jgi:hypothetical protein
MPRVKASRPATAETVRKPRAGVSAGQQKLSEANKTLDPTQAGFLAVFNGQTCIGHLLLRGKSGVEAFDADDKSLGLFPDQKSAADALTQAAGGAA